MNILLFGPPGAGKGTQSALLVENKRMKHISTGDLFRAAIKNQTRLGLEARTYIDKGQLVPDSITIGMVEEVFMTLNGQSFILDGFPRNVAQGEALENLLKGHDLKIDKALFLEVPIDQLMGRLTGRRVCTACGATYHVTASPPKKEGVCDKCGGSVIQRADDKEDVIRTRLMAYEESTKPLKDFYKSANKLVVINGLGSTEEVYGQIEKQLL